MSPRTPQEKHKKDGVMLVRFVRKFRQENIKQALPLERDAHPIDVVQFAAELHHIEYDRPATDEFYLYHDNGQIAFDEALYWHETVETLAYSCSFDIDIKDENKLAILKLVSLINTHLLTGHFDFQPEENLFTFRYALLLQGGVNLSSAQCQTLLEMGPGICSKYIAPLRLVGENDMEPDMALRITLFDVAGQA